MANTGHVVSPADVEIEGSADEGPEVVKARRTPAPRLSPFLAWSQVIGVGSIFSKISCASSDRPARQRLNIPSVHIEARASCTSSPSEDATGRQR